MRLVPSLSLFFFFNDTATTEIYTLSLHDALPISIRNSCQAAMWGTLALFDSSAAVERFLTNGGECTDRKSTRLNSSHLGISYAVFCLKKKKVRRNVLQCIQHETELEALGHFLYRH